MDTHSSQKTLLYNVEIKVGEGDATTPVAHSPKYHNILAMIIMDINFYTIIAKMHDSTGMLLYTASINRTDLHTVDANGFNIPSAKTLLDHFIDANPSTTIPLAFYITFDFILDTLPATKSFFRHVEIKYLYSSQDLCNRIMHQVLHITQNSEHVTEDLQNLNYGNLGNIGIPLPTF